MISLGTRVQVVGDKRLPPGLVGVVVAVGREAFVVELDPEIDWPFNGCIWYVKAEHVTQCLTCDGAGWTAECCGTLSDAGDCCQSPEQIPCRDCAPRVEGDTDAEGPVTS